MNSEFQLPPVAWVRARSTVTANPPCPIRSTNAGSASADQTARQPPGLSADLIIASPEVE